MNKAILLLFIGVLAIALIGCGGNTQPEAQVQPEEPTQTEEPTQPEAPAQSEEPTQAVEPAQINAQLEELIDSRCTDCHTDARIKSGLAKDRWPATVDRMISHGANISVDERDVIVEYLQEVYSR